jgi:hypothetical protein
MNTEHCFYLETEGGDVLETEGGEDILLYCLVEGAITYGLIVDWDGLGLFGHGCSEEDFIVRWSADRGRERLIGGRGQGFEPYRVGTLRVTLDNSSGRYNPYNTAGPLYGKLRTGKQMRFQAAVYDPAEPLGFVSYDLFAGTLTNLTPVGWNKNAYMDFEDGLGRLNGVEIEQIGTDAYQDDVAGWIKNIADLAGYPYDVQASENDPNDAFLAVMYIPPTDALQELHRLTSATLGSIAAEADGTLAYHSIHDADAAEITLTDENTLSDVMLPLPWEYVRDRVVVHGYQLDWCYSVTPRPFGDNTPRVDVPAGASVTAQGKWHLRFAMVDGTIIHKVLVGGWPGNNFTNMQVWSSTTGNYADRAISSFVTGTVDFNGVDFMIMTFSNSSGVTRYVHEVVLSPVGTFMFEPKDRLFTYGSAPSGFCNGEFVIKNNLYWSVFMWLFAGSSYYSSVMANITAAQQARLDRIGGLLIDYLSEEQPFPVLQIEQRPEVQFGLEVERRVHYTSDQLGIDADYRVAGLKHETLGTTQAVRTTVFLYPLIPDGS